MNDFRIVAGQKEVPLFNIDVSHSQLLRTSAIHVYDGQDSSKLYAVSHLIGSEQLPTSKQVCHVVCVLGCHVVCVLTCHIVCVLACRH